ncbi:MAG: helix-turn-helix domain-containing protein [Maritimibacter sp.]|nr:helix-turn-helix domain-containing protein [Maritimibacter sp.]
MKKSTKTPNPTITASAVPSEVDCGVATRLIRDAEGAALLGCSKATWWRRVADGTLPPPLKIGGMSRWKMSDVLRLIEEATAERS